jgi:pilus assembly protein CpaD
MNRIAFRAACLATLALPVALTAGCANKEMTTGSIPMDYRERHPIVLTEAQSTLDIPVGPNDARLTIGMKDTIKGFAQTFAASSAGQMLIQMPHGSPNAAVAARLGQDIRATLAASGIRNQRIVLTGYAAQAQGDAAPIRLSFVATRAVTAPCGEWPEDLSNDTAGNRNWYNFGCASQNNLAAQIANPSDLIAPRGVTPIDAARRSTVIGLYRSGADPSSD